MHDDHERKQLWAKYCAYLVAGGIDNGVVVLLSVELLGVALDGDTTLTLLLAGIKEVGEAERGLAHLLGLLLELGHLTLGDAAALEDQVTAGGGLTGIDVAADNEGEMFLTVRHGWVEVFSVDVELQINEKSETAEIRWRSESERRFLAWRGAVRATCGGEVRVPQVGKQQHGWRGPRG